MANDILCYGIISKVGSVQVDKIDYKDLGKPGFDYQVVSKTVSEDEESSTFDILFVQDGKELETIEIKGWKFTRIRYLICDGTLFIFFNMIDMNGCMTSVTLNPAHSTSTKANSKTREKLIKCTIREIIRIAKTYDTIGVYHLCKYNSFGLADSVSSLSAYISELDRMSEYCRIMRACILKIRESPQFERDRKAFENTIKPQFNNYIKTLNFIKFSQSFLSI